MKNLCIFASGSGSNFSAIADNAQNGILPANVDLLVCDNPTAKVLAKAENFGIPSFSFYPKNYSTKAAYESEILRELNRRNIDFIALAGYMRLIGPTLLNPFKGRIVNIHPSLLPSFPGRNAVGQALAYGVKVTGVTVHYVDEGIDTGEILAQKSVAIEPFDTEYTISAKIHAVEHELYTKVLREIL